MIEWIVVSLPVRDEKNVESIFHVARHGGKINADSSAW